ncbi:probable LRR receptor-like serine/threonine-protein kinase At3g47570 [Rosa chinensis]|uniref:probable LRR receptor-like serine/threonine-protein kinase At3g47570 n=1 Tax=Rosa chinensis TaxID=74649 RepID=UPI001AD8ACF7|nr:probable LRR receptor-like serine/threonine-protein kinase At3g47570 [Rosa chinensis]
MQTPTLLAGVIGAIEVNFGPLGILDVPPRKTGCGEACCLALGSDPRLQNPNETHRLLIEIGVFKAVGAQIGIGAGVASSVVASCDKPIQVGAFVQKPESMLNINFDAGCSPKNAKVVTGVVVRDSSGRLQGASMCPYAGNIDRGTKWDDPDIFQVSYNTLLKATDRFSSENLIGVGTFGSVYKVFIDRAQVLVAVKVFNLLHQGSLKSFIAECEVLRSIRHSNIVKIITSCSSIDFRGNDFKALVYEFMENVHCDLKPSNILLDNDLTGRVSDFGLARFLSKPNNISTNLPSVIKLRGPVSYVAPEYETGSEASTYGDVYSFGILLLEMFTGKKSTDDMFSYRLNLHKFVSMSYFEGVFSEIADPRLLLQGGNSRPSKCSVKFKSEIGQCLRSIFEIGIVCSRDDSNEVFIPDDSSAPGFLFF